jgi:hypothetical protein
MIYTKKLKKTNSKINSIFETMNEFLKFGHCYPKENFNIKFISFQKVIQNYYE